MDEGLGFIKKHHIPLTRDHYLEVALIGPPPKELDADGRRSRFRHNSVSVPDEEEFDWWTNDCVEHRISPVVKLSTAASFLASRINVVGHLKSGWPAALAAAGLHES